MVLNRPGPLPRRTGDGSLAAADPQTHPALRALAYFNIDPAVAEGMRYGRKP